MKSPTSTVVLTSLHTDLLAIETDAQLRAWVETQLRAAPGVGEVTLDEPSMRVTITLHPHMAVRDVIAAWQIARPYAVSGDVHQRSWSVRAWVGDLTDPYNTRIATSSPQFGRWDVEPRLTGRPPGPLPAVVSGASPAYDLLATEALVSEIIVRPAQR